MRSPLLEMPPVRITLDVAPRTAFDWGVHLRVDLNNESGQ